jgi:hypothetical protein
VLIPIQIGSMPLPDAGKGQNADGQAERQKPAVAWQREMERAQMELWLRQRPLGHGHASSPVADLKPTPASLLQLHAIEAATESQPPHASGVGARDSRDTQTAALPASGTDLADGKQLPQFAGMVTLEWFQPPTPTAALPGHVEAPLSAPAGAIALTQSIHRVWNEVMPGAVVVPAPGRALPIPSAPSPAVVAEAAVPTPDKSPPPVQQPPVRVQYHLSEAGLAVWLGVDRGVAIDVQALVLQLRQALERQGLKLHSLTHNGRSVLNAETDSEARSANADAFASSLSSPSPGAAP